MAKVFFSRVYLSMGVVGSHATITHDAFDRSSMRTALPHRTTPPRSPSPHETGHVQTPSPGHALYEAHAVGKWVQLTSYSNVFCWSLSFLKIYNLYLPE